MISAVMPAAALVLPLTGEVDWDDEQVGTHVADGARAYVRAAVGVALGACETAGGPTCILGDRRRNVRLAGSDWSRALEAVDEEEMEAEKARGANHAAEPKLDLDDFPDL